MALYCIFQRPHKTTHHFEAIFFDEVLNINQEIVRNMHNIPFLELNDHEVLKYQLYTVQARSGKKAEKDPT